MRLPYFSKRTRPLVSIAIAAISVGLAYIPLPGSRRTLVVVSGTELQEPLTLLADRFEATYPTIDLDLRFQGSQDMVNAYVDRAGDVQPTVLIPANGQILEQLRDRMTAQGETEVFWEEPRAIVKTVLVGIAWPERGQVLFPNGRFDWHQLERALQAGHWSALGGAPTWGSFDFVATDPARSNSGQLTLGLWTQAIARGPLTPGSFGTPEATALFGLVRRSVYLPPRSTDILLQEFIARGPNDADVATVYESIALYRWSQAAKTQNGPYRIYYVDPTIETVSTAAIVRRDVGRAQANAARELLDFLTADEQQEIFVRFGFRPVVGKLDLTAVPESPWAQDVPGARVDLPARIEVPLSPEVIAEVQRTWQRAR
ncbi:hypothetical protein KR51_00013680 [Rubidibacter lacunae KORDI 51-2]|uniref:ABC-type Fe3+ transport system, periplasmic component n=1 Tax=Rubidibacter lacunae KORDI 51-2 TaxID=582515 RepID=U5DBX8_9CHRO|nr:substrate-binding domain-containing protein [Rubidibacter lacunae]ERN42033.1 hypothetical protein KR51_00013680 [Rubidibacter lacunae KORDI 51-2]